MHRIFVNLGLVIALAPFTALAQPPAAPAPPNEAAATHRGWSNLQPGKIVRALNLTVDQKAQAKTIFQQARDAAQPIRQQLQQSRQAMEEAVKNAKTGPEIQQLAMQEGNLVGQLTSVRGQAWAQFFGLLTPAQRAQANQLMQ